MSRLKSTMLNRRTKRDPLQNIYSVYISWHITATHDTIKILELFFAEYYISNLEDILFNTSQNDARILKFWVIDLLYLLES